MPTEFTEPENFGHRFPSLVGQSRPPRVFDVTLFGAKGDGYVDDHAAIQSAVMCALACSGAVFFPPGTYLCDAPICFPSTAARISFFGDGQNVSVVLFRQCSGFDLSFPQSGAQQPYGAVFRNMGIRALGACNTGIRISYGTPPSTSDHNQPSCAFSNLQIVSDPEGTWTDGIDFQSGWNPTFDNVFISGDSCGGNWNAMRGAGITLLGMCVNAHLSNVRCNFFAEGLRVVSSDNRNTEGIFCSNCSMVGVQRGYVVKGDQLVPGAPRISTITIVGGLVECRVKDVEALSAAIHLENVWTALVTGVQVLAESLPDPAVKVTYGILAVNSSGVVVTCCDVNAFNHGIHAVGPSKSNNANGCTFTNVKEQVVYAQGVEDSRSYGHTLFNGTPFEYSYSPTNKMGFVN